MALSKDLYVRQVIYDWQGEMKAVILNGWKVLTDNGDAAGNEARETFTGPQVNNAAADQEALITAKINQRYPNFTVHFGNPPA